MEKNGEYQGVCELQIKVDEQLLLCEEYDKILGFSGSIAMQEIDEHFMRCMEALAMRRDTLLNSCSQKIQEQSMI